jgi:hypothetical protein
MDGDEVLLQPVEGDSSPDEKPRVSAWSVFLDQFETFSSTRKKLVPSWKN